MDKLTKKEIAQQEALKSSIQEIKALRVGGADIEKFYKKRNRRKWTLAEILAFESAIDRWEKYDERYFWDLHKFFKGYKGRYNEYLRFYEYLQLARFPITHLEYVAKEYNIKLSPTIYDAYKYQKLEAKAG